MANGTKYSEKWFQMGKRVKECRENRGLSRNELAELIQNLPENTSQRASEKQIGYIETGTRELSTKYAEYISKALNVKAEYLLLKSESPYEIRTLSIPALENEKKMVSAIKFLKDQGIVLEQIHPSGGKLPADRGFFSAEWPAVITINSKNAWQGDVREVEAVLNEICEFAWFKIERLLGGYRNG